MGYVNGHLAAAQNHNNDRSNLEATMDMVNISPMYSSFNNGIWRELEEYVHQMRQASSLVESITVAINDPNSEERYFNLG